MRIANSALTPIHKWAVTRKNQRDLKRKITLETEQVGRRGVGIGGTGCTTMVIQSAVTVNYHLTISCYRALSSYQHLTFLPYSLTTDYIRFNSGIDICKLYLWRCRCQIVQERILSLLPTTDNLWILLECKMNKKLSKWLEFGKQCWKTVYIHKKPRRRTIDTMVIRF